MSYLYETKIDEKRALAFDITLPITELHRFFTEFYSLTEKKETTQQGIIFQGNFYRLGKEERKVLDKYVLQTVNPLVDLMIASESNRRGFIRRVYLTLNPKTSMSQLRLDLKEGLIITPEQELGYFVRKNKVRFRAEIEPKQMEGRTRDIQYFLANCQVAVQSETTPSSTETIDSLVKMFDTAHLMMDTRPYSIAYEAVFSIPKKSLSDRS